jgi:hypothetical protein
MGVAHLIGPGDTEGKCVICLMLAKQAQWEMYQDELKAAHAASGEVVRWLAWPSGLDAQILDGPYTGVPGEAPQLGVVRGLCWDHVAGIGRPKVQHIAAPMPPGLMKGRG